MANPLAGMGNWFVKNPQLGATLASGAMTIGGGLLAGRGQEGAAKAQQQSDNAATAAKMMGDGPLAHQKQRFQMEMMRNLLGGKLQGPMISAPEHLKSYQGSMGQTPVLKDEDMKFLSNDSMAAAEQPYWNMVNKLSPGTMTNQNLANAGYGQSAYGPQGQATAGAVAGAGSPEQIFNQNYAAIAEAKKQTGDWEKAYQQVTGTPWPKGQHITIGDNGGQMVKDESKWKKAANIALTLAPIAAAPFTGGASLMALGAGAGAAKSLLNGGGMKGALTGGAFGALGSMGGGGSMPFSMGVLGKQLMSPQGIAAGLSGVGGKVGQVAGMAAPFLPGAKFPTQMGPSGMPGPMNPRESLGLPGAGEMPNQAPNLAKMLTLQGGANPQLEALRKSIGRGVRPMPPPRPAQNYPEVPGFTPTWNREVY